MNKRGLLKTLFGLLFAPKVAKELPLPVVPVRAAAGGHGLGEFAKTGIVYCPYMPLIKVKPPSEC